MISSAISTFVSSSGPWPWYVAGPVIGLFVPALLIVGNRVFGVSSSLRHMCSAVLPGKLDYFRYDWRRTGLWNLLFLTGILVGGFLDAHWGGSQNVAISEQTRLALMKILVGFGTAYAGGCTSGHAISGLADMQLSSLIAVVGFFAGGLIATHFLACERHRRRGIDRTDLFVDRFEVEISQIHVTVRQYVYGEIVLPLAERNFEKLRSQIPVVPLTPGQRICRVMRCRDLQRSGRVLSVHID